MDDLGARRLRGRGGVVPVGQQHLRAVAGGGQRPQQRGMGEGVVEHGCLLGQRGSGSGRVRQRARRPTEPPGTSSAGSTTRRYGTGSGSSGCGSSRSRIRSAARTAISWVGWTTIDSRGLVTCGELEGVEADEGDVLGHPQPRLVDRDQRADGQLVVQADDGGRALRLGEQAAHARHPGLDGERAGPDRRRAGLEPVLAQRVEEAVAAALQAPDVRRPGDGGDAPVPVVDEVAHGLPGRVAVVEHDRVAVEPLDEPVDEHDRQAAGRDLGRARPRRARPAPR